MEGAMTGLENFLLMGFREMPLAVRVITYLFILLLFGYLLLVPKFINGELELRMESGGSIPYRGVDLKMHVDGRLLKFRSNEDGIWSIPLLGHIPRSVEVRIFHEDQGLWYPVTFKLSDIWRKDYFQVEILSSSPWVTVAALDADSALGTFASVLKFLGLEPSDAMAGRLELPESSSVSGALSPEELHTIQSKVFNAVSNATGKELGTISRNLPLRGTSAPTYAERIKIILALENRFKLRIPDEHWRYMDTVGELVDYMEARRALKMLPGEGLDEFHAGQQPRARFRR